MINTFTPLCMLLFFVTPLAFAQNEAEYNAAEEVSEDEQSIDDAPENQRNARRKEIVIESNSHVQNWIRYFSETDRERFQRFLQRGSQYREIVESVLHENELPPELYYLAMIESGYRTRATSIASAVGVWQFISGTATRYGLEVNRFVDERRDPIRSTEAAAKYLTDLYNIFGSWHLAMSAYNAGEYRIVRAVVRGKSRDFWTLVKLGMLPKETADYVPKFMAAVTIGSDLKSYGFHLPPSEKYPDLKAVEVPAGVALSDVASVFNVPISEVTRVNPHIRTERTPPGSKGYEVWLPESVVQANLGWGPKVSALQRRAVSLTSQGSDKNYYKVRRGDTLDKIARQHRLSSNYLKKLNGLKGTRVMVGQRLRVTADSYHSSTEIVKYRVRPGDNLSSIAKRFRVTVKHLIQTNSLKSNRVMVGQLLMVLPSKS